MLKKLASILLLVGFILPYGCDVRPVATLVAPDDSWVFVTLGVPIGFGFVYVLFTLVPPVRALLGRRATVFPRVLGLLYLLVVAWTVARFVVGPDELEVASVVGLAVSIGVTLALLRSARHSATREAHIALLLLAILGVPVLYYLVTLTVDDPGWFFGSDTQIGHWFLNGGYLLAVLAEGPFSRSGPDPAIPSGG